MAILSISEIADYLPDIDLTDQQLRLELVKAEAIATGPSGSNRQLDLSPITETISIGDNETARLRFWPIELTRPVTVAIRNNTIDATTWMPVPGTGFVLTEDGGLQIDLSTIRFDGFGRNFGTRKRPTARRSRLDARIEYWAGYDFRAAIPADWELSSSHTSYEAVLTLKAAIAQIVALRLAVKNALAGVASRAWAEDPVGAIAGKEVERIEVDGAYSVQFAGAKGAAERLSAVRRVTTTAAGSASELEDLLNIFRTYRARSIPI